MGNRPPLAKLHAISKMLDEAGYKASGNINIETRLARALADLHAHRRDEGELAEVLTPELDRLGNLLHAIHERMEDVGHDQRSVMGWSLVGNVPHTQLRELQWMERTVRRIWDTTG
jgi:uncharacterized protein YicC (UPF0701 family)